MEQPYSTSLTTKETMELTRRDALKYLLAGALAAFSTGYPELGFCSDGNFRHIYLNPKLRAQFLLFLQNVFNLYPEHDLHSLITRSAEKHMTDREIYQAILAEIPSIKPVLSELQYALPSLKKQKEIMCAQTMQLLDGRRNIRGYLEIGTTGRYFDRLSEELKIQGPIVFVSSTAPTYGAADIVERGQVKKIGSFIPLGSYDPLSKGDIEDESLDLVTVYIGYHHAPLEKRMNFIRSCYRVLRRGGMLIVRDHDVVSTDLVHFVALAHDVFNAGLELPWHTNEVEIRHFLSLRELEKILNEVGFQSDDRRLLQGGDPTRNTLMKFVKI